MVDISLLHINQLIVATNKTINYIIQCTYTYSRYTRTPKQSTKSSHESTHFHTASIRTTNEPFHFYRIRFRALLRLYLQRGKIGSE